MEKSFLILLLVAFAIGANAQNVKMGKISKEEIEMTSVSYEPDASAVVLWEEGESRFEGKYLATNYFFRKKILAESGKDYADVRVPYYLGDDRTENISEIKGLITNVVNGELIQTQIGKENIFEVEVGNGWHEVRISFPNVQIGSIIEYSYRKMDKNLTFLDGWSFQNAIPTLGSKYQIEMTSQLEYKMIGQGYKFSTTSEKSSHNGTYNWILRDLYSLKEEPYMKNYGDYSERVEFQLARYKSRDSYNTTVDWEEVLSNWIVLGDEILDHYRQKGYFRSNPIEKELLDLDITGSTQLEQAQKAYMFIRDNFSIQEERGFWPEQFLPEVLKTRSGTPEELNLALMGVLSSIGIQCDPVLIGSKGSGRSTLVPFPFLNQFDEIMLVATLDGQKHYLDLSDPLAPFGYIDLDKHVSQGLLLQKKNSQLVPIEIKHNSNTVYYTEINLDSADHLVMNSTLRTFYYEGLKLVRMSKALEKANEPMENLFKTDGNIQLSDVVMTNELEGKNYTSTSFKMTMPGVGNEELIVFNPLKFSNYSTNPFTQEYRVFPVDFGFAFTETYNAKIVIPEGYELDDYPLEERITIPGNGIAFFYSSNLLGNTLNVISKFEVRRPIIQPSEYGDLKFFMESVASKLSAPVIFKKVAKP